MSSPGSVKTHVPRFCVNFLRDAEVRQWSGFPTEPILFSLESSQFRLQPAYVRSRLSYTEDSGARNMTSNTCGLLANRWPMRGLRSGIWNIGESEIPAVVGLEH